jgi:hypothetical protein
MAKKNFLLLYSIGKPPLRRFSCNGTVQYLVQLLSFSASEAEKLSNGTVQYSVQLLSFSASKAEKLYTGKL